MKKVKIAASITLAASILVSPVLSNNVSVDAAAFSKSTPATQHIKDVNAKTPYYKEIMELHKRGITLLDNYGYYQPNNKVTRDEAAEMFAKTFKTTKKNAIEKGYINLFLGESSSENPVTIKDLTPEQIIKYKKILGEKEFNRFFSPKTPYLSKQNLAYVMVNLLGIERDYYKKITTLKDLPTSSEYNHFVSLLSYKGYMDLSKTTMFYPEKELTKAEFAYYLYGMKKKLETNNLGDFYSDAEEEIKKLPPREVIVEDGGYIEDMKPIQGQSQSSIDDFNNKFKKK